MRSRDLFLLMSVAIAALFVASTLSGSLQGGGPTAPLEPHSVDPAPPAERSVELPIADVAEEVRVQVGAAQSLAPSPDLSFDLAELAVPNVLLIDENTDRPLANVWCRVKDVHGVTVVAKTNSIGRMVSDELLLTGDLSLALFVRPPDQDPPATDLLGVLNEHASARFGQRPLLSREVYGLQHTGNAAQPDRWKVARRRWVPLEIAGSGVATRSLHLALPVTFFDAMDDVLSTEAKRPQDKGLDESLMAVSEDGFPMVFEVRFDSGVSGTGRALTPHQWTRERLKEPVPGRVVRAVQFLAGEQVICATAEANVVPALHQWPLRLEFAPLVERDTGRILATYGQRLGPRIISHLGLEDRSAGFNDRFTGTVTSDSGLFHEEIRVTGSRVDDVPAAPLGGGTTSSLVKWKKNASGEWVGHFDLRGLGAVQYLIRAAAEGHQVVEPTSLRFSPEQGPHVGTFVVRDLMEYVPVVLRMRQPAGGPNNRCFAMFKATSRERSASTSCFFSPLTGSRDGQLDQGPARDEGHTLTKDFPRGGSFRVSVQTNGYEKLELTHEDFEWDGHRLVCDRVLRLQPE